MLVICSFVPMDVYGEDGVSILQGIPVSLYPPKSAKQGICSKRQGQNYNQIVTDLPPLQRLSSLARDMLSLSESAPVHSLLEA